MSRLIARSIEDTNPPFLTLHTQNQHMVQTVRKFCPKGYLFPIDGTIPKPILEMGSAFAKYPDRYNRELMLEHGFYLEGNPLYGDRKERVSSHSDIRNFFKENVDFQNGDSLLVIGIIPKSEAI